MKRNKSVRDDSFLVRPRLRFDRFDEHHCSTCSPTQEVPYQAEGAGPDLVSRHKLLPNQLEGAGADRPEPRERSGCADELEIAECGLGSELGAQIEVRGGETWA